MTEEIKYLSCADTAKLVRKELKKHFPGQKFSVRSSVYAGGASIDVSWTDGPGHDAVDAIIKPFAGAGFDGMIDLKFYKRHWMLPDGSVQSAESEGTADSMGVYEGYKYDKPHPDAVMVHFGADFVFGHREISDEVELKIAKDLAIAHGIEFEGMDTHPKDDFLGRDIHNNWYGIVREFIFNKSLVGFKGISKTDVESGQWYDFFKVDYEGGNQNEL